MAFNDPPSSPDDAAASTAEEGKMGAESVRRIVIKHVASTVVYGVAVFTVFSLGFSMESGAALVGAITVTLAGEGWALWTDWPRIRKLRGETKS